MSECCKVASFVINVDLMQVRVTSKESEWEKKTT